MIVNKYAVYKLSVFCWAIVLHIYICADPFELFAKLLINNAAECARIFCIGKYSLVKSNIYTQLRVTTFHAETSVVYHQSLSRQVTKKGESPTAVVIGNKTPKSNHGSCENV